MQRQTSLADLLKLLLSLRDDCPVYATPSFLPWLRAGESRVWPPPANGDKGLLLVDTRDRVAARDANVWRDAGTNSGVDAALVLSGSRQDGSLVRRALRRIAKPRSHRLSERRVSRIRQVADGKASWVRLAFVDRNDLPTSFGVGGQATSSGAGFLVSRRSVFDGPLWSSIANRLGEQAVHPHAFHLRARGAAVVLMRADDREFVVRLVPDGPLQSVVQRNHSSLSELRRRLDGHDLLLRHIPRPLFAERMDSLLLLGESGLPGTLAWKLASGPNAPTIRRQAIDFLHALRVATLTSVPAGGVGALLQNDLVRVGNAAFVSDNVKRMIRQELSLAAHVFAERECSAYTSHGDFGYGNILVDPQSGKLEGVIDWDTTTLVDFPGIDRVNMEIQVLRGQGLSFVEAVDAVWQRRSAHGAFEGGVDPAANRVLFGVAVCRFITRAFSYPALYRVMAGEFEKALSRLELIRTGQTTQVVNSTTSQPAS